MVNSLNKVQEWETFLQDFKNKHKGKKKLMQMISLLSDSTATFNPVKTEKK
jgi:hypothetical protein